MSYNSSTDSQPTTKYVSEKLGFSDMMQIAGEARTRKNGAISSGAGEYSDLTTEIKIAIDCKQAGRMSNLHNAYLTLDISNNHADSVWLPGRVGSNAIVSDMTFDTNTGVPFSKFNNYNVLMGIEICKHVDKVYLDSWGSGMFGMSSVDDGGLEIPTYVSTASKRTVVIPLSLSNLLRLIPLWGVEQLNITIKIADPRTVYIGSDYVAAVVGPPAVAAVPGLAQGDITYSNVRFVYETIDIPKASFDAYVLAKNNEFTFCGKDWFSTTAQILADVNDVSVQIPISRACVSRVIVCLRNTASITTASHNSLGSRNRGYFTESYLQYNGVSIPYLAVKSSSLSVAEQLAELMIANGNHLLGINNSMINEDGAFSTPVASAVDAGNTAYGFYEFSLTNTLENNDDTYSGMPIGDSTLTLILGKGTNGINGATTPAQTINIFVEYQTKYTLKAGMWSVNF